MEHRTVLDQTEITRDGTVQVRLALEIVDDDGTVLAKSYHRTSMPPGHDINGQMDAVNAHLVQMGKKPVSTKEVARLHDIANVAHTPELVQAYKDRRAEERRRFEENQAAAAKKG